MTLKPALLFAATLSLAATGFAQESVTTNINRANAKIARESVYAKLWDGPTTGPKIEGHKLIIFIGADFRNTGIAALMKGVKEATTVAGWDMVPIDCWGLPNKRADAFSRAMALKPDGIIIAGINARDQAKEIAAATAKKIPVIGWHAGIKSGPGDGLFNNIGTDPKKVGETAATLAIADSNGKAGVVVYTDPTSLYAIAKSNEIVEVIKKCQNCSLLALEEINPTGGADQMPASLSGLAKRLKSKWTHVIAVHDMYIDWMETPANLEQISDLKLAAIGAGDGAPSSFQRLHKKSLQMGIVPEPLNLQGWQLVDELNRAQHNAGPTEYKSQSQTYVVTQQNLAFHGGPKNQFDPDNGYRNEFKKIWGK